MKNIKINDVIISVRHFSNGIFKVSFLPRTDLKDALLVSKEILESTLIKEKLLTHFNYSLSAVVSSIDFTFNQTYFSVKRDSDIDKMYDDYMNSN